MSEKLLRIETDDEGYRRDFFECDDCDGTGYCACCDEMCEGCAGLGEWFE